MKKLLVAAAFIAFASSAMGQDTPMRATPDALTWKDNPAFPKGIQIATVVGDPTKAGEIVVQRIKFPPNFICRRTPIPCGGRDRGQRHHRDEHGEKLEKKGGC